MTGTMMRVLCCLLAAAAGLAAADKPNRDVQELQRDVAQLQDSLKAMQQALEARLSAISTQLQGAGEATAQLNANTGALQKAIAQVAQDQERKIAPAIAEQGTRLDQLGGTVTTLQQAVADLTTAVNRLQTQVVDVGNAVKVIQSPAAPPKPAATDLLRAAEADKLGGKYELALQEYSEFLKYYPDAPEADLALFELGLTQYATKDFDAAGRAFDTLPSKYPESKRIPEALLYKAKSLAGLNRAADARAVCVDLRKRYATSDAAKQCPIR